ncbi:MAG TPA: ATP-binding protein [Actinomycetota bacterium]|nr:ATP-binding protein [Actinomycetota bacterium]
MLELRLRATPDAPRDARHALDRLAPEIPQNVLENVRLLVSELVTNCIRHAGVDPGATIELKVRPRDSIIRVEVSDPGEGFEPAPVSLSIYSTSGWGLYLVEQIADRWGVQVENGTKVWFEIAA